MRLSGGKPQLTAEAQPSLKVTPALPPNEPTSSVDMKTERAIMMATERLMQGRTSFLITHRLSTLEHCDIRLEFEHGRLVSAVRTTPQNASPSVLHSTTNAVALPGGVPRG